MLIGARDPMVWPIPGARSGEHKFGCWEYHDQGWWFASLIEVIQEYVKKINDPSTKNKTTKNIHMTHPSTAVTRLVLEVAPCR